MRAAGKVMPALADLETALPEPPRPPVVVVGGCGGACGVGEPKGTDNEEAHKYTHNQHAPSRTRALLGAARALARHDVGWRWWWWWRLPVGVCWELRCVVLCGSGEGNANGDMRERLKSTVDLLHLLCVGGAAASRRLCL